ncbi:hypothetical protein [Paucilactobacillus nenjiangensis]|uniref:Uncharacterized protein n=1 Tax=Paucilactobacillus nenjiangensis TaxID=1296540 RepID=A0A5P1X252_9LACO|nr:hypothetical protein [Paucilactobacillus nenjiangensis]QER67593.1 hypothetical protein F0161_06795 [Paucilactobacillus nenjiangensis]
MKNLKEIFKYEIACSGAAYLLLIASSLHQLKLKYKTSNNPLYFPKNTAFYDIMNISFSHIAGKMGISLLITTIPALIVITGLTLINLIFHIKIDNYSIFLKIIKFQIAIFITVFLSMLFTRDTFATFASIISIFAMLSFIYSNQNK